MFLPEIYMFLQRISTAPRQAPSIPGAARAAVDPQDARHAARVLPDGDASGRTSVPGRTPRVPPANEWDEWKSVRDVA